MTTVNIPLDDALKCELDEIAEALGMDLPTLFMIYAEKVARDRAIPFMLEAPLEGSDTDK